jgi:hypothetical protein
MATDGRCHAREYFEATPECKKSLLALVNQYAVKGTIGKMPQNGHPLQNEFEGLFCLKPGDHRFLTFRHLQCVYVTNGGPKIDGPQQNADYRLALRFRNEFFSNRPK